MTVDDLLESESFTSTYRWRSNTLVSAPQAAMILSDLQDKYDSIQLCSEEWRRMSKSTVYAKIAERLRVLLKLIEFVWRSDQGRFFQYVSEFYSIYGEMLTSMKHEKG